MSSFRRAGSRTRSEPVSEEPPTPAGAGGVLRPSGTSAVLAGLLWAAGVGGEIALQPQRPDGSVVVPVLFGLCTVAAVAGAGFLVHAFRGLRAAALSSGGQPARPAGRTLRAGSWSCVAGALLLLVFSAAILVSGLATGRVWEPSFLAFALGMVLLLGGQLAFGLALRRHHLGARGVWPSLVVAGACVVVALGVAEDPWHDLGMFGLFAAWVALGSGLLRGERPRSSDDAGF